MSILDELPGYVIPLLLTFAALSALVAHEKHRNPFAWAFVGFFFGFIGFLVACCVPEVKDAR